MRTDQLLVLLAPDPPPGLRERIRARYRVTQEGSPRLLLVAQPDDAGTLRAMPGVLGVFDDRVPAEAMRDLDAGESLFVQAWSSGSTARDRPRPGEGLPWDAPGRLPPDPPRDPSDSRDDTGG